MKRHVVRRPDGNAEREIKVCGSCETGLSKGMALAALMRRYAPPPVPLPRPSLFEPVAGGESLYHDNGDEVGT